MWQRLIDLARRRTLDHELESELTEHFDALVREYEARGVAPADARAAARRDMGNLTLVRETYRDQHGLRFLETLWQDLRIAARAMRTRPAFTVTVVLTLAVGIGANAAIFSVVNAVLLRPLPYGDAGQLVTLWTEDPKHDVHEEGVSYRTFDDWRTWARGFQDLAYFSRASAGTITSGDDPERIESAVVSANFFSVLGVRPILGRSFTADDADRRDRLVIVSHGLWQRRFGGATDAIGRQLEIDGVPWRVIGVMPAFVQFPSPETQVWEQLTGLSRWPDIERERYSDWGRVVGRLRADIGVAAAQTEMTAIGERLERTYPLNARAGADFNGFGVNVVPLTIQLTGRTLRFALWVLSTAVFCVLLIACINVANLLLARGAARTHEMAIRRALGASRPRIVRQMLTESLLIAIIAEAVGIGVAAWGLKALLSLAPSGLPRLQEVRIDSAVIIFASVLALIATVLVGLMPALRVSRVTALSERGVHQTPGSRRLRTPLVVGQVALSSLLLCAAVLLIRSFERVRTVDSGFRSEHVLTMRIATARTDADAVSYFAAAIERIRSLPGVATVGVVEDLMQRRNPDYQVLTAAGGAPSSEPISGDAVSPDYFRAAGVRLLKGRSFSDRDRGGPPIAIVNETMARHLWSGEDPIGKEFREADGLPNRPWYSVVGVVADTRRQGLDRRPIAQIFWQTFQRPTSTMDLVIRASGDPAPLAPSVRQVLRSIDTRGTVFNVATLDDRLDAFLSLRRFQSWLMALLAALALGLATIGTYAVMHYTVVQRTIEIGVRMALGAGRGAIVKAIVREGVSMSAWGIAVGLGVSFFTARMMASLLFEITASDPVTFTLVAGLMAGVGVLASAVPAWRASRVDPMLAFRIGQ